jgi:hypothetical protein
MPELRPCVDRLVADWDDFGGDPPGQYSVFPDTYAVWIKILVILVIRRDVGRPLLQRALDFGEEMLTSGDADLVGLAIDCCAEQMDIIPGGRELAARIGGPALRRWMAEYSRDDWERTEPGIIDLWGVREVVAGLLPQLPLADIPGITQPADHHRLGSLAAAHSSRDGMVMLYAFGKSGMFVLARSSIVHCGEADLLNLAVELAPHHHRNDTDVLTRGQLGARYFDIPTGEKVWNMTVGNERHARLTEDTDLWVGPRLEHLRDAIRSRLAGTACPED